VVFAFGADQADFRATDFVIDAGAGIARWGRVVRSAGYGFVPSVVGYLLKAGRYLCEGRTSSGKILREFRLNVPDLSTSGGVFPLAGFIGHAHLACVSIDSPGGEVELSRGLKR